MQIRFIAPAKSGVSRDPVAKALFQPRSWIIDRVQSRRILAERRTMKALLIGFLLTALILTSAQAGMRMPAGYHALRLSSEKAATACFAETIAANPKATALAKARRWYEAAGIAGFLCRPEVDAMIQAHDGLNGLGSGVRYFQTSYIRRLGRKLAVQLQSIWEFEDLISVERSDESTSLVNVDAEAAK